MGDGTEAGGSKADGQQGPARDRKTLTKRQQALLYFNTTRRKFWAGAALVAVWFLLMVLLDDRPYLELIPNFVLYAGIPILWVLFTHGAGLIKPVPMPADIMRQDAPGRFSNQEEWESPLPPEEAFAALQELFTQTGVRTEVMDASLWVELGKEWQAAEWWHRDAAPHMKRRPSLLFFVQAADGGSRVTAFSVDRALGGLYDVVKLSDEMSATAVGLARKATGAPPQAKPPKGRRK
ncbi:hypothetical protein [Arthrobacter oryzae]|uniref:hypothetical protein n=1 Tax=Arthrobacter oryzae TaxID=409290 RepID=UPI002784A8D3|nr:hypothetical protein [Arthrobacter oryzae]MDQ0078977.1 hypothetical protein [Arthrobacter oryzae]